MTPFIVKMLVIIAIVIATSTLVTSLWFTYLQWRMEKYNSVESQEAFEAYLFVSMVNAYFAHYVVPGLTILAGLAVYRYL